MRLKTSLAIITLSIFIILFSHQQETKTTPPTETPIDDICIGELFYKNKYCIDSCIDDSFRTALEGVLLTGYKVSNFPSCHFCPSPGGVGDAIWNWIEKDLKISDVKSVLDAGTGYSSFKWLQSLEVDVLTAVTASKYIYNLISEKFSDVLDNDGYSVLLDNWFNRKSDLPLKSYGVVLADYLIGSVEGYTPFQQDKMLGTLKPYVNDKMYVIGQQPYAFPTEIQFSGDPHNSSKSTRDLLMTVFKFKDSVASITNQRFYREYPLSWIIRNLEYHGYLIEEIMIFPSLWGTEAVLQQLENAQHYIDKGYNRNILLDPQQNLNYLRELDTQLSHLKKKVKSSQQLKKVGVCFGFDYVVVAKRK